MTNLARNLRQLATYWVQTGTDLYGKGIFSSPVQRVCRWEDMNELFIDKMGQEVTCKSRVFFVEDLSVEGYLFNGNSSAADPTALAGTWEIRQVKRTPDLRAIRTLYVAYL